MCKRCRKLHIPKEQWPQHDSKGHLSLDDKIAVQRRIRESKMVKIPLYYADNDVRRARIKSVRQLLDLSSPEMAAEMGISESYYRFMEHGTRPCTMTYIKLAERLLRAYRSRTRRHRKAAGKILTAAGIPLDVPVKIVPPDNAVLRARVISMFVTGYTENDICRKTALSPDTVRYWISRLQ